MTKFPKEDQDIVNFLQQHRPQVPAASPNLEQQILQQVQALPIHTLRRLTHLWLVPSVIASGFLAVIFGYPALIPSESRVAETSKLETFMESNWQNVVSENSINYTWQGQEVYSDTDNWQKQEVYIE
ncbi:MAG TPA: hypothetical protein VK203_10505 [Nostocaceae cyanobacterium]|nr:hypothetical protein [Nostocaceae cyanobacterium]